LTPGFTGSPDQPVQKTDPDRQHQGHALPRPAVYQEPYTEGQDYRAKRGIKSYPPELVQTAEGAEHQAAPDGTRRTTPIRVHPVTRDAELDRDRHAAQQGPPGRQPRLQRPTGRPTYDSNT